MDKLIEALKKIKPHIDYENEKKLIDDGLLDSFDVVVLIGLINDEFGVSIPITKITPDNLNSVDSLLKLINSLK